MAESAIMLVKKVNYFGEVGYILIGHVWEKVINV